jgi:hypothetical protein
MIRLANLKKKNLTEGELIQPVDENPKLKAQKILESIDQEVLESMALEILESIEIDISEYLEREDIESLKIVALVEKVNSLIIKKNSLISPRRVAYVPLKSSFIPFLLSLCIHVNVLSFVDYLWIPEMSFIMFLINPGMIGTLLCSAC